MEHSVLAKELFEEGYNCSQSILAAFCDETGLDKETSLKMSSSFGAGMGKMREVCGAVTGMFMVVGLKYGYTDPLNLDAKSKHYELIQCLSKQFKAENNSIICRELLDMPMDNNPIPAARTDAYYKSRPCTKLVEYAAKLLDEYISKN